MNPPSLDPFLSVIRLSGVLPAVVFAILTWGTARLTTSFLHNLGERLTERRLWLQQAATFLRFIIYFVGTLLVTVTAVELNRETVLAISGTLGVAFGLALKDLASSIIAGITILVDKPFQVGDRIAIGNVYGEVVTIGLRSVRVVTLDDNLVTIPNNRLLADIVSSGNAGALDMLVQMDFHIGTDQNVREARQLISEALTASQFATLHKPWAVLVTSVLLGDTPAIRLRAKVYVRDVKYEKRLETDVTLRVLDAFAAHGVLPPTRLHRQVDALKGAA